MTKIIKLKLSLNELCSLGRDEQAKDSFLYSKRACRSSRGQGKRGFLYSKTCRKLMEISKLRKAGLSLERIRIIKAMGKKHDEKFMVSPFAPRLGEPISCIRIYLCEGIELLIDPYRADFSFEEAKHIGKELVRFFEKLKVNMEVKC